MAWADKRRTPSDYIDPHKAARILAAHGHGQHLCGHEGGVLNVDHDLALGTPTHGHPHMQDTPHKSLTTMPSRTDRIATHHTPLPTPWGPHPGWVRVSVRLG